MDVGDTVDIDGLPVGPVTLVGLVGQPLFKESSDVLLAPGELETFVGDPRMSADVSLLVSGTDAEQAAERIRELWYAEGQQLFWPEPAVDPLPSELAFLQDDPYTYRLLTERDVDQLVALVREAAPDEDVIGLVYEAANQMIYGSGAPAGLPDVYVDTRTQWLNQGGFEDNPAVMSTAASAIVLVEVAFITGAAFAAGTRRRLREIGLLSANGASMKHVRTTVVGEGLTIALIGATTGVVVGTGVMIVGRPILQRFVSRVITGAGVSVTDVAGPMLVALVAVLLAVLIPARTASWVPTTTALQGRMPALAPRRRTIPLGIGLAVAGGIIISVALASTSNFAGFLVGVGATAVVAGTAMLSSPILASITRFADHVPATSRLVLRDSGRNRTRSAVAVAAIMVILLAPVTAMITAATTAEKDLIYGLPSPSDQLVLTGSYANVTYGRDNPITDDDIAALAAVVPDKDVARFDTLDIRVVTAAGLDARATDDQHGSSYQTYTDGYPVAVANDRLVAALGHPEVGASVQAGDLVILGIADRHTRVELDGRQHPAREFPIPVVQWGMPRVLIPETMIADFAGADARPLALFVLDRPMTSAEQEKMWNLPLSVSGGHAGLDPGTVYLIIGAATLLVVLIVVVVVTAVSAAEVDEEIRTIVAVGAPGSIRRRFLGLLTTYQALVAMALAVPLGIGLVWVFSSAQDSWQSGPFGIVHTSWFSVPWTWLAAFAVTLPIVIGILTVASVRSAPVTPPRRST